MNSTFKNKKFETEVEFYKWLDETTYKIIFFKDNGQDLLKLWISESGEIIHTNLQMYIWTGRFINLNTLKEDCYIQMWNTQLNEWVTMDFFVIDIVTYNTNEKSDIRNS